MTLRPLTKFTLTPAALLAVGLICFGQPSAT
jgi:hypothetical protein